MHLKSSPIVYPGCDDSPRMASRPRTALHPFTAFVAIALAVLLASLIAGCGSEGQASKGKREAGKRAEKGKPAHQAGKQGSPGHGSANRPSRKKPSGKRKPPQRRDGLIVSRCDYHSPTSSRCGAVPASNGCSLRDGGFLQDRRCTPGAIDPRVRQGNLNQTICRSGGYTDTVRPPTSYTTPLEFRLIRSYDLPISPDRSELDHLISLELGGAPSDPRNLFPEPYKRGAYTKDTVENQLHDAVCAGRMSLVAAQRAILVWVDQLPPGALPKNPAPLGTKPHATGGNGSGAGTRHRKPGRSGKCDPNYSGACLDPKASDYDCKGGDGDGPRYVQGPIRITGRDHFGLGTAGDKIACE